MIFACRILDKSCWFLLVGWQKSHPTGGMVRVIDSQQTANNFNYPTIEQVLKQQINSNQIMPLSHQHVKII